MQKSIPYQLLAKSFNKTQNNEIPRYAKLEEHCFDAYLVATTLFDLIGRRVLENSGLPLNEYYKKLKLCLKLAALIHDVGKANDNFYETVTGQRGLNGQLLRHEVVTYLLFASNNFGIKDWLLKNLTIDSKQIDEKIYYTILFAVIGHHRKFDEKQIAKINDKDSETIIAYLSSKAIKKIIDKISEEFCIPKFDKSLLSKCWSKEFAIKILNDAVLNSFKETQKDYFKDANDRIFLGLLKSLLVSSDVAASALAIVQKQPGYYLTQTDIIRDIYERLNIGFSNKDFEELLVNWQRKNNIENLKYKTFQQQLIDCDDKLILVEAGCGGGKSLGAYVWGQKWCKKFIDNRRIFKMVFCLPTTGTTTEHFVDYALNSGVDSRLCHSRANVDLKNITIDKKKNNNDEDDLNDFEKIEALESWATPLSVVTVDTVLGILVNGQKAMCSFPALTQSVFVFDEIHAYDETLFTKLLEFLAIFKNVPILLMTASLPEEMKQQLRQIRPDIKCINGDKQAEDIVRYKFNTGYKFEELLPNIDECVKNNKKVLIIKNTVKDAGEIYTKLAARYGYGIVSIYHSRFCYKHKSRIHRAVIDKFKNPNKPSILVATQVAEMSLDLSANLLISDEAPIPALIQRLGRLNRKATKDDPWDVFFLRILFEKPYDSEELAEARNWIYKLANINNGYCSQSDLMCELQTLKKQQQDTILIEDLLNSCTIMMVV